MPNTADPGSLAQSVTVPSDAMTDLVFWNPTGYRFNSATDWNQWRYISDGLTRLRLRPTRCKALSPAQSLDI